MNRLDLLGLIVVGVLAAGCGDNSKECGEGTVVDDRGLCVPSTSGAICGDGTVLDPVTGSCKPDGSVCGSGTVLINGTCQDPTAGIMVDVEEGPEPNGFELNATPAGTVHLKPIGGAGVVVHGCIRPIGEVPDFDDYLITVTGPTLIKVTADGVHGLAAGFVALAEPGDPQLASWQRFGVNIATDTSRRELYLPKAGTYDLYLTDTRTLLPLISGVQDLPAAGDPSGNISCYYVTIDQRTVLTTPFTATAGASGTIGEDLQFFSASAIPDGINELSATFASAHATPALVVENNNALRQVAGAIATFGGIKATDTPLLVLDFVDNYALTPVPFQLSLAGHDAAALPTGGTPVTENAAATSATVLGDLSQFYFDAAARGDVVGLDLHWNVPVDGVLVDQDFRVVSEFSWDPFGGTVIGFFSGFGNATWTDYRGLFRAPAAGRYYFLVYRPSGAPGAPITATSRLATLTPPTLVFGTPITNQAVNPFNSNPFLYTAGTTELWQAYTVSADAASGGALASAYDAATAFGRIDRVTLTDLSNTGITFTPNDDLRPVFTADSGTVTGHLQPGEPASYFLTVTTANAAGTFGLGVDRRTFTDEGTHAPPFTVTHTAQTVGERYLIQSDRNAVVTVTVTPRLTTLDPSITFFAADEAAKLTVNAAGVGAVETGTLSVGAHGYVAFEVDGAGVGTYDLTIDIAAPYYTVHDATTAFTDICATGTVASLSNTDDGMTSPIDLPMGFGFSYYGAPVSQLSASANGWFHFSNVQIIGATGRTNVDIPTPGAPDALVAAYWADLDQAKICTKASGTTFTIQWTGVLFADTKRTVQMQAVLDTSDDSIELVYGTGHKLTGAEVVPATVGIENATGTQGTLVLFGTTGITPGASKKFTHP